MASFSAELEVAGALYLVRSCTYDFTQVTSERGRVVAKVRHGLVHLTLDVPDASTLLD
jgi:tRNA threonylcarbamoyladenosine modification (KEOPS) complex  Pcc1 subunit